MGELISIIVPVYNVEKYIKRCIDSICNQTYKDLEVILVNDGSTDYSGKICKEYVDKDSRIKLINKQNGGLSSARNAAIDIAKGQYYIFVDSDDYISKECVEYLLNLIKRYDADIAIGNYIYTSSDNVNFEKKQYEEIIEYDDVRQAIEKLSVGSNIQMVTAWAKIYKRECFDTIRYPEGLLHEDEGTTYKIYYNMNKIVRSNQVVYAYYYNPESIMRNPKVKNYVDLCSIFQEQIEFYQAQGENALADQVRNRWCIQIVSHMFPLNYYGISTNMKENVKRVYNEITNIQNIAKSERVKGWLCGKIPFIMALVIKLKQKMSGKR